MKRIILNIIQAGLIIYIVFISGEFYFFSLPFILIQMITVLFLFWAIIVKRLHKQDVKKHKGSYWIKDGPYEFVRHPIYAGLLLFTLTYVQEYLTIFRGIVFILFVVIILIRMREDERLNDLYFKGNYREYKSKTKRLIPYLY